MPTKHDWFVYSYVAFFTATFLLGVLISIAPSALHWSADYVQENSFTNAVNTTMGMSNMASQMPSVGLVLGIGVIMLVMFGSMSMGRGMGV